MDKAQIYTVICTFVSDIIHKGTTTDEEYYACEKCLLSSQGNFNTDEAALFTEILTKANQLMWVNLTLEHAQLSTEKRDEIVRKKEDLIEWFVHVNGEVHEHKKDINH